MSFNYQSQKLKWWKKEKADIQLMRAAGMREDEIEELFQSDWQEFLSERNHQSHNFSLEHLQADSDLIGEIICDLHDDHQDIPYGAIEDYRALLHEIVNKDLFDSLSAMNPINRQIILLRFVQDLPIRDIAAQVGLSENAVKLRIRWLKNQIGNFLS